MDRAKKEKELSNATIVLMAVVALFYDVLGALFTLVAMYWLVTLFYLLTFFLWFRVYGVTFWKPKRLLTMGSSFIIELIPIVSVLPAMTAAVLIVALDSKIKKVAPVLDIMNKVKK